MTDDVLWPAEPHTLAKHAILTRYLNAWLPILSHQAAQFGGASREILFVDGFAGPGEYTGGQPGSPVLALEAALNHSLPFPVPVRFLFIEEHPDRCDHLKRVLDRYSERVRSSRKIRWTDPLQGECSFVLTGILDKYERSGTQFGPALAFLDQFGYTAVSMDLVRRILEYPQCEVFLYLDYRDMNRFISDPAKADGFTRTYGGEDWRGAIALPESKRRVFLLEEYRKALRGRGNASYVHPFSMFDSEGRLLYWLVFCTNNLCGLEQMKKAMWKVDDTGSFRFSDKDNPAQLRLLNDEFGQEWLAKELAARLMGRTLTVDEIKAFVLVETPCCQFKPALKALECSAPPGVEVLDPPAGRRRGTYPDKHNLRIRFGAQRSP